MTTSPQAAKFPAIFFAGLLALMLAGSLSADLAGPKAIPEAASLDLSGTWWMRVMPQAEVEQMEDEAGERLGPGFRDSLEGWRSVTLPATWEELGAEGLDGVIWLRRSVQLPRDWQADLAPSGLGLALGPGQGTSVRIYTGRALVAETPGGILPVPDWRTFELPPDAVANGGLRLTLRIRRFASRADEVDDASAPFAAIRLGDREVLRQSVELIRERRRSGTLAAQVLAVLFLVGGLYHLLLWIRRRELHDHLYFALLSLDVGTLCFIAEPPVRWTESQFLTDRWMACFEHLSGFLLIQFLWIFLGAPIGRWLRAYQVSHLVLSAAYLVVPWTWLEATWSLRWIYSLPLIIAISHLLATEAWRGNSFARIMAPGAAAVLVAASAEMIVQVAGLGTTFPLPAWAFGLFTLGMVVALSTRHARERRELDALRLQLERMVDDRTTELRHANERLEGEISERQLAEEAMRMLERAVEQSIDGIAVADLEGQMQFINEAWARMHGYEVFELLGYDLEIFHTPEQMRDQVRPLIETVRQQGSHETEIEHRRRGGETFPTWMTATYLQDSEGSSAGIVFIARDITERKKAEEERLRLETKVKQAEKLESLGSLAGGIAHDYNNILTGVLGNASLAFQELPETSPIRQRMRQIEISAERAAELTDQLLAYAGEEQHVTRVFSLNDLIREQEDRFEGVMSSGVQLETHLKKDLPSIEADPAQITQAILNLLHNASDSLRGEGGVVMLRTSVINAKRSYFDGAILDEGQPEGRYVFFEVSDSGVGMDPEIQSKMFDPFFTTKATGRGLGLAAVLGIVRAHDGAIKVYSQPGRGTTVEALFPVHREVKEIPEESGIFRLWQGTGTALVVDDEELVREVAVKVLERQGFDVLRASDGPQALEIFERRKDDIRLVLLDLTMPQMDGETVFREIRRHGTDVRVLLMSGYREKSATQGLEGEGLAGFLHKPFRPNELVRKVREVLVEPEADSGDEA